MTASPFDAFSRRLPFIADEEDLVILGELPGVHAGVPFGVTSGVAAMQILALGVPLMVTAFVMS